MSSPTDLMEPADVIYPDSDGLPMAENTLQYEWIVKLQGNLDILFQDDPNIFVAGDNLIYPVKGNNAIRQAPDVYVAIGRQKGHRGSYRVWLEAGTFPQVVIEVLSPGNRRAELKRKFDFYERYGAEEYFVIDPDRNRLRVFVRRDDELEAVPDPNGWKSPRLGIRFDTTGSELIVTNPDGTRFLTFVELGQRADRERHRAEQERQRAERAEQECIRAEQERHKAEQERQRTMDDRDRLAARLRELGIDPDAL